LLDYKGEQGMQAVAEVIHNHIRHNDYSHPFSVLLWQYNLDSSMAFITTTLALQIIKPPRNEELPAVG
jgi:hypothetical protein